MNRRRRAALSWVAIAAIAAVVLVGAVLRSNRFSVAEVDVAPGTAWLALVASGEAMLVNGGSGEVALRVAVAEPGSPLEVVQHGDGAIVLDKEGATLQTVSARSFEPTGVTPIGSVPDSLVPGERTVHVTTDEAILTFDPATLEPTGEVALAGELDALVDRDERLWVLDHGNDALHRVEGDEIAESLDPGELGAAAALTLVDDRPVVVDPASATITVVDDDGLGPAVEVGALAPGGDVLVVEPRPGVELPAILMIVPEEGRYLACDVDAPARCEDLTFGGAGDSFGPPQYVDDRLFVPDRTTGRVVVIDTRRNEHITTTTVLREPTQQLELVATDDLVWFNNLGGSEAGVLDENGEVRRVVRKLGDDVELTDDALGEGDGEGTIERRDGGVGDDVAPDDASGDEADDAGTDTSDTSDAVDDGAADGTDTTTGVDDGGPGDGPGTGDGDPAPDTEEPEPPAAGADPAADALGDPDADTAVEVPRTGPDGTEDPTTEVEAGEAPGGVDPVPGGSEPVAAGDGQPDPPADPATTTPDTTVPGDELEALFAVSADLVEVGTEVRFEDRSSGEPTSWEWDFDDGGTASGERAAHTWDEAGTYRVVLTVTDEDGETRTRARDITVENDAPLRAGFRAEARAEVGEEVQLLDDSVGEPDEWLWTFDDDTTSTDQDPTHRWRRAGVFVVTLEVRRGDRTDAVQHSIEIVDVIEPPEARFESPTRARTGVDIQFADRSTGDPTSWEWDFGDGSGSTRVNPVHRYRDEGEYTVGLTVANSAGESEEFTRRLVVEDPTRLQGDYRITSSPPPRMEVGDAARLVVDALVGPAVDLALPPPAGATPPCELADVTRNGTTVSASVRGVAAGPCRIDITQPPSTGVDPAPGRSIRVEVGEPAVEIDGTLSLNGETGTLRTTVGFAAPLNIGFDLVTDPADVAEYRWSFGNGRETVRGSATGGRDLVATAPGGFFRSGDQTFELVVLADSGERTRVTMPISIAPPPLEIVPPPTVVAGRAATFGASSGDVPVSSWTWHFDDGSPPVAQPPGGTEPARTEVTHTFPSAGRFSARVVLDTGFETVARQVAFDVEEPGGADLVIVSVSGLTVASCPGGDMVAVTVTVRNDGNVTSEARPSGGPLTVSEIGGGLGGGAPLPAIPAGATAEVRVGVPCANQQLCPPYAGATVSYRAEISASVGPPETNTANNVSAPFSVTYPVGLCDGYGGADLVIVSVTDVAVSQCPGVKVTVSVSVRNDGTVASEPRPGVGAVQFGQPGTNLGQGVGLPSIAPGQTVTVPISVACGDEAECAPYAGSTVAYEARIGASGPPQTNTANDVFGPVNVTYPPGLCDGYAPTGETTS